MFRGREVTHPERGTAILDRLAEELSELGVVEQRPMQEGRNMTMMMAPSKAVLAGRVDVGEISNGEVHNGAHMGDVASAAIDSPLAHAAVSDAGDAGGEEDGDTGSFGVDVPPVAVESSVEEAQAAVAEPAPAEDGAAPADPAVS